MNFSLASAWIFTQFGMCGVWSHRFKDIYNIPNENAVSCLVELHELSRSARFERDLDQSLRADGQLECHCLGDSPWVWCPVFVCVCVCVPYSPWPWLFFCLTDPPLLFRMKYQRNSCQSGYVGWRPWLCPLVFFLGYKISEKGRINLSFGSKLIFVCLA